MLNFVIADDNIHYTKSLINYLTLQHPNLKLISICTNGREVLEIIYKIKVDILILDLKMPYINGLDVLTKIMKANLATPPSVFVISGEPELLNKIGKNPLVAYVINKTTNFETISYNIGRVIQKKKNREKYSHSKRKDY